MKASVLLRVGELVLYALVATALLLVYFTNVPLWADAYLGVTYTPTLYASLILIAVLVGVTNISAAFDFLSTQFAKWCIAVMVVYALNYWRLVATDVPADDVVKAIDRMQFFLMAPVIGFLVYQIRYEVFQPLLKLLAVFVPLLLITDFFFPDLMRSGAEENIKQLTEKSRVSGTWFNPNAAGEAIILSLLLARHSFSRISMALIFTLAGLAMILTGSRSGMIILVILGAYMLFKRQLPIAYLIVPIILVVFFSTFLIYVEDIATYFGRGTGIADTIDRLEFVGGNDLGDESSESRLEIAMVSLKDSLRHPFLGHGITFLDPVWLVGPHNMLVAWIYLYGIFGMALWLGLPYVLIVSNTGQWWDNPALLVFIWYSMFSHNILESNFWFIFFAITVYCASSKSARNTRSASALGRSFSRKRRSRRKSSSGRRRKRRY